MTKVANVTLDSKGQTGYVRVSMVASCWLIIVCRFSDVRLRVVDSSVNADTRSML